MNQFCLLILSLFVLNCTSKDNSVKSVIPALKLQPKNDNSQTLKDQSKTLVIFDTLVFDENMMAEELDEKYKDGKSELNFYKKFIKQENINRCKTVSKNHTKSEIKYLGKIHDLNKQSAYHVLTNFTIIGIGEMISPRGQSVVAFVNNNLDKIIIYNLEMPENLPISIKENVLYFQSEKSKIGISIYGGLPFLLCLPGIGCY